MAITVEYKLSSPGSTDFTLTLASSPSQFSGQTGYAVTSISGTIGGDTILGLSNSDSLTNIIYTDASQGQTITSSYGGVNYTSGGGSYEGLDIYGLSFYTSSYNFSIIKFFYDNELYGYGDPRPQQNFPLHPAPFSPMITYTNYDQIACYCSGTRILIDSGERAVEDLSIGDTVVTATGQRRRIRWIGRRSYGGRFLAGNPNVQPVRFHAGALGNGLPRRDLLVSPEHAMFLDDVLVAARLLLNGDTIVQETDLPWVDYFHVELDSHDVLLAEGAPSESFVDDDSRGMFHNAAEWEQLYPDRERVPAMFCAPRVESGMELKVIQRRLWAVAEQGVQAA